MNIVVHSDDKQTEQVMRKLIVTKQLRNLTSVLTHLYSLCNAVSTSTLIENVQLNISEHLFIV